jgi:anti-anti-sigma regulatory factor
MARIRSTQGFRATRVSIAGRLTASDMGRLERACSQVLATHPMRLDIDLSRVTFLDATARAVLEQMTRRGAVVKTGR